MTRITAKRRRPSPLSPSDGVSSEISIRIFCYGVEIAAPVGGSIVGERRPTAMWVATPHGASSEADRGGGAQTRGPLYLDDDFAQLLAGQEKLH